jgi:hypothetical protein
MKVLKNTSRATSGRETPAEKEKDAHGDAHGAKAEPAATKNVEISYVKSQDRVDTLGSLLFGLRSFSNRR